VAIFTAGIKHTDLRRRCTVALGVGLWLPMLAAVGWSQQVNSGPQLSERFESAATTWQFSSTDVRYRVDGHRRVLGQGRSGSTCEEIALSAAHGSYLYIAHPTASCRVVSELSVSVWLKATRPDLQILARVVLPNAHDPQTGKPLFALVRGSSYKQPGAWEELRVTNIPQLLERQVRVLRAQHGSQIDSRGAYVDLAVINVYGGEGATQVWLDDLQVTGAVLTDQQPPRQHIETADSGASTADSAAHSVRLSGTILNVNGRPIFPRIIEYQGEPLALLVEMGFNGIRVSQPPSAALLAEAERSGMWDRVAAAAFG
jgi:hypothetical protein